MYHASRDNIREHTGYPRTWPTRDPRSSLFQATKLLDGKGRKLS